MVLVAVLSPAAQEILCGKWDPYITNCSIHRQLSHNYNVVLRRWFRTAAGFQPTIPALSRLGERLTQGLGIAGEHQVTKGLNPPSASADLRTGSPVPWSKAALGKPRLL